MSMYPRKGPTLSPPRARPASARPASASKILRSSPNPQARPRSAVPWMMSETANVPSLQKLPSDQLSFSGTQSFPSPSSQTFGDMSEFFRRQRIPSRNIVALATAKSNNSHIRLYKTAQKYQNHKDALAQSLYRAPYKPEINENATELDEVFLAKNLERIDSEVATVLESPWHEVSEYPLEKLVPEKGMKNFEENRRERMHIDGERWKLRKQYLGDDTWLAQNLDGPDTARECSFTPSVISDEEYKLRKRLAQNPFPPPRMTRTSPTKRPEILVDHATWLQQKELERERRHADAARSDSISVTSASSEGNNSYRGVGLSPSAGAASPSLRQILKNMMSADSPSSPLSTVQSFSRQDAPDRKIIEAASNLNQADYTASVEHWRTVNMRHTQMKVKEAWQTRFTDSIVLKSFDLPRDKYLEMIHATVKALKNQQNQMTGDLTTIFNLSRSGQKQIRGQIAQSYYDLLEEDKEHLERRATNFSKTKIKFPTLRFSHAPDPVEVKTVKFIRKCWDAAKARGELMLESCRQPIVLNKSTSANLLKIRDLNHETRTVIEFLSASFPRLWSATWTAGLSDTIIISLFDRFSKVPPSCILDGLTAYLHISGFSNLPPEMKSTSTAPARSRSAPTRRPSTPTNKYIDGKEKLDEKEKKLKMKIATTLVGINDDGSPAQGQAQKSVIRSMSFSNLFSERFQNAAQVSARGEKKNKSSKENWAVLQRAITAGKVLAETAALETPTKEESEADGIQKASQRHLKLLNLDPKKLSNELFRAKVSGEESARTPTRTPTPSIRVNHSISSQQQSHAAEEDNEVDALTDHDPHISSHHIEKLKEILAERRTKIMDAVRIVYYDFGDWFQAQQKTSNEMWQRVRAIDRFLHSHDPNAKAKMNSEFFIEDLTENLAVDQTTLQGEISELEKETLKLEAEIQKMAGMLRDAQPPTKKSKPGPFSKSFESQ